MICPTCHATIKDHSKFCSVCGAPIPQETKADSAPATVNASAAFKNHAFSGYTDSLNQVKAMKPESFQSAIGDNKFLMFLSGCLWILPILGTFMNTIKATSSGVSMGFSLFSVMDISSLARGDEVMGMMLSQMRTWLILYVIILVVIAAFAIWQSLGTPSAKAQVIYSAVCLPLSSIILLFMNAANSIFNTANNLMGVMSNGNGTIGLNFFGWLVLLAIVLIFISDLLILWNIAKKVS